MGNNSELMLCPCGSGKTFRLCCKSYFVDLNLNQALTYDDSTLTSWLCEYSHPIEKTFQEKTRTYIFRISAYIDAILEKYLFLGYRDVSEQNQELDEAVISIKMNILHSLLASLTCLSQGLFLQSGALLRSAVEDCLVLLDISENKEQLVNFLQNKYSTNNLISRVKKSVPDDVVKWYGYFSANFSHFGPLHPAPYLPRACYADNYVIVIGLQDIVRAVVTFHIILERVYFDKVDAPLLWKYDNKKNIIFNDDSKVFTWVAKLEKEVVSMYPPNERKRGFFYTDKTYKPK